MRSPRAKKRPAPWSRRIFQQIHVDQSGNAHCFQKVIIRNNRNEPVSISGPIRLEFPRECSGFSVRQLPGHNVPSIVGAKQHPFFNQLLLKCPAEIPQKASFEFEIEYNWPSFCIDDEFKDIIITHDSLAHLTLSIRVPDNRFKDHYLIVVKSDTSFIRNQDYSVTEEGYLQISTEVSPNDYAYIKVIAKVRIVALDVVDQVARVRKEVFGSRFCVLLIQHMLRDFISFLNGLITLGVAESDIFIMGIPYSTKDNVYLTLHHQGYKVHRVAKEEYSTFIRSVFSLLKEVLQHCVKEDKKLIIIEDGGYAVPLLHDRASELNQLIGYCHGAVEQTRNGIWADKEVQKATGLAFPVINVAESRIKDQRESPLIGDAVITNVRNLLAERGEDINGWCVAIAAYGNIGKAVAHSVLKYSVELTVFDTDPGTLQSITDPRVRVASSHKDLVKDKDLIIGCSGHEWLNIDQLSNVTRKSYFVNATSKRKEIDWDAFLKVAEGPIRIRKFGSEYRLKIGSESAVYLLADGFPVNFFGESVPDKKIQFIPALLLAAASLLATESLPNEIIELPERVQEEVEELMKIYRV